MESTMIEMQENTSFIKEYFAKLGFETEMTALYLALFVHGPQTISELARNSGVERTRIYRLTDNMVASKLVEVEIRYKRAIYKAAPISNIQIVLAQKEQELRDLHAGLEEMRAIFTSRNQQDGTRVQFYNGLDGLKQIFWNETRATTEVLVLLFENMQGRTQQSFFERWVRRANERGLKFRGIVNDSYLESQQKWYDRHDNERLANWQARHLPDDVFAIRHSTVVYDNVVMHNNWRNGEIYGMEIYGQEIADMQRSYFELLWKLAQPIEAETERRPFA